MKRASRPLTCIATRVVLLACCLASFQAEATVLDLDPSRARLEALARRAEAAVVVRVLSTEARIERGRIVSDVRCEVIDAAYGATPGSQITLTTLGGFRDNIGQRAFGLERPAPDEELILLLGPDGYMGGGRSIVGFSLGMYRVLRAESEPLGQAAIVGSDTVYRGPLRELAPLTVAEFFTRVRAARATP